MIKFTVILLALSFEVYLNPALAANNQNQRYNNAKENPIIVALNVSYQGQMSEKSLFNSISIDIKYDKIRCPNNLTPISVTYKNNSDKIVYRVRFTTLGSQRNYSEEISESTAKGQQQDAVRLIGSNAILKPKEAYQHCHQVPISAFDRLMTKIGGKRVAHIETKDDRIMRENFLENSVYKILYKEITFSDGEIISGYENQEGVIWEK